MPRKSTWSRNYRCVELIRRSTKSRCEALRDMKHGLDWRRAGRIRNGWPSKPDCATGRADQARQQSTGAGLIGESMDGGKRHISGAVVAIDGVVA